VRKPERARRNEAGHPWGSEPEREKEEMDTPKRTKSTPDKKTKKNWVTRANGVEGQKFWERIRGMGGKSEKKTKASAKQKKKFIRRLQVGGHGKKV